MDRHFQKILIANRGEIALRIIRAVHGLDKHAVVVHSDFDSELPFVTESDEAHSLGPGTLADTYLNADKILRIALENGVDAIHPGYGFLAENAGFAEACAEKGVTFIGPGPESIRIMGDKSNAREKAKQLGLPVLEGITGEMDDLIRQKDRLPYPLLIKPSAGGGGKGMRIVQDPGEFEEAARGAAREAANYFGSPSLYVERYLENPRHIEMQVLADHHGNAVHLFERECSIQRRYQKIIEEAPSAAVGPDTREALALSALELVRGMGYTNAGTVEFLLDHTGSFYFLEMNTRIQVEHPVTEMVTGIDLVREQIAIAEGQPLSFGQSDLHINGHAIEARLYAEDPGKDFMPATGRIEVFSSPAEARLDAGYRSGNLVEPHYDPMIAKLVVHGKNREQARSRLISALKEIHVTGLTTNRDFLIALARTDAFGTNNVHTRYLDLEMDPLMSSMQKQRDAYPAPLLLSAATLIALQSGVRKNGAMGSPWEEIGYWRIVPEIRLRDAEKDHRIGYELQKGRRRMKLVIDEEHHEVFLEAREGNLYRIRMGRHVLHVWGVTDRSEVHLDVDGHLFSFTRPDILDERYLEGERKDTGQKANQILAPLNGRVVQVNCREGESIKKGHPLLVIESMKMENKVLAPHGLTIEKILVSPGEQIKANQIIITLAPYEQSPDQQ